MLSVSFHVLFFNLCIVLSCANEEFELLFVQILWRHGDRSPIQLYPNDPNPESVWNEGLGKLTMLGRKQHYALGKYFRKMYENFSTWSPNEVSVMSSDCDRCMNSAETNLASFFAPSPQWKFDPYLNWQPLPVYYIPKSQDKYLETESDCPQADAEQARIVNSPQGQAFITKHKAMFHNLTVNSGFPIVNWTEASYLYDVLSIEKKYNLTVPAWAEPYWYELETVADLSFHWSFNSPLLHRLRAGPFLKRMIEIMNSKLSSNRPLQKFQIYSAHDTTIAVILGALNLFNMKQPPYCASLIFELYRGKDSATSLRLLYQNSTNPETQIHDPQVLILDGCQEFCPFEYFINFSRNLIPDNWEEECQLKATFLKDKSVTVGFLFAMMAVIILVISIYSLRRMCHQSQEKYSYTLMSLDP